MSSNKEPFDPETGEIIPNGSGPKGFETSLAKTGTEIGSISSSAQAAAAAMATLRSNLAGMRPRNMTRVREALLAECKREGFAEGAMYSVKRGRDTVSGPSIRFAEAIARALGNLSITDTMIHDDDEKRVIRVSVLDFESNTDYGTEVVISKVVERSSASGRKQLGQRIGSNNQLVFLCAATEEEVQQKKQGAVSKVVRNNVIRMLPADILEDAIMQVSRTLRDAAQRRDPKAVAERMIERFGALGVSAKQLEAYLGIENISAGIRDEAVIEKARSAWSAIRSGEATVASVFGKQAVPHSNRLAAKMGVESAPAPQQGEDGDESDEGEATASF